MRVTGRVQLIEPNEQTDGGYLAQGGLLAESGAEAAIRTSRIAVPGVDRDDVPRDPPARMTTVAQLLADPRAWDDRPLVVRGRAYAPGPFGFVLATGNETIFVGAPASDLSGLEPGERVRIRAELERISRFRANTIREAIAGTPETDASTPDFIDLDQTPSDEGQLFLVLRAFVGDRLPG